MLYGTILNQAHYRTAFERLASFQVKMKQCPLLLCQMPRRNQVWEAVQRKFGGRQEFSEYVGVDAELLSTEQLTDEEMQAKNCPLPQTKKTWMKRGRRRRVPAWIMQPEGDHHLSPGADCVLNRKVHRTMSVAS